MPIASFRYFLLSRNNCLQKTSKLTQTGFEINSFDETQASDYLIITFFLSHVFYFSQSPFVVAFGQQFF
jgi:hypothetical protein